MGYAAVLGVGLLAAFHGKEYYALGYYPVLFAFGAVWWETRLAHVGQRAQLKRPGFGWKTARQAALVAVLLALLSPFFPFVYPVSAPARIAGLRPRYAALGMYRWEDGRDHALPQDYADMRGWRELAAKTWAAYQSLPDSVRAHTLIHCANHGQASAINYYNRGRPLPPARSLDGSFLYWYPSVDSVQAILMVDDEPDDELAPHFAAYRRFGAVADPYARERGTAIIGGLRPDRAVRALVRREWRAELAAW